MEVDIVYVVGAFSWSNAGWWLVAGGSNTVIWERGYLLAIPFTRENHRSILVVTVTRGADAQ